MKTLNMYKNFMEWLTNVETWQRFGESAIRIALIIVITHLLIWIVNKSIDRILSNKQTSRLPMQARRMVTVGRLLKNIVMYACYLIGGMLLMSELGIQLGPLLAGAGIVGLAIGFGAQSLVKDIITGFFIILEDQFAVGDVIQAGQFKGTVEVIGLRTTRLLSWTGEIFIIPNGMINEVTNFSLRNSVAVVDVAIGYEEDVDRATSIIQATVDKLEDENLAKPPEVLGIQLMGATEVKIRIIAECLPNTQHALARKINLQVKKALVENGMDTPYPRMVTYHRDERSGERNGA
ncbi:mechanosensitive ion channel family protein [Paenibacillus algorifonticola]|uniref:mechanosensitive ion channel family protein n=1 Tax=Paenibacillus algorifonticola TaxID=684063 RepID=UPI003D2CC1C7